MNPSLSMRRGGWGIDPRSHKFKKKIKKNFGKSGKSSEILISEFVVDMVG